MEEAGFFEYAQRLLTLPRPRSVNEWLHKPSWLSIFTWYFRIPGPEALFLIRPLGIGQNGCDYQLVLEGPGPNLIALTAVVTPLLIVEVRRA